MLLPKKKKKDKGNADVAIGILRGAANFNEVNRKRTSIVGIASAPNRSATPSVAFLDSWIPTVDLSPPLGKYLDNSLISCDCNGSHAHICCDTEGMLLQSRERHDKMRRAIVTDLYERAYTRLKHAQTGSYDKLSAGDSLPKPLGCM